MKYQTIARIMFPLAAVLFLVTFVRFCVRGFQAQNWVLLLMGAFCTLSVLTLFVGFWSSVKRKEPITEHEVLVALSVFLAIASIGLLALTPE